MIGESLKALAAALLLLLVAVSAYLEGRIDGREEPKRAHWISNGTKAGEWVCR